MRSRSSESLGEAPSTRFNYQPQIQNRNSEQHQASPFKATGFSRYRQTQNSPERTGFAGKLSCAFSAIHEIKRGRAVPLETNIKGLI